MQLSFPSTSTDVAGIVPASSANDTSATANTGPSASPTLGFAQLLAGIVPLVSGDDTTPGAGPESANGGDDIDGAPAGNSVTGQTPNVWAVLSTTTPLGAMTTPTDLAVTSGKAAGTGVATIARPKKSLVEEGDDQAVAVAMAATCGIVQPLTAEAASSNSSPSDLMTKAQAFVAYASKGAVAAGVPMRKTIDGPAEALAESTQGAAGESEQTTNFSAMAPHCPEAKPAEASASSLPGSMKGVDSKTTPDSTLSDDASATPGDANPLVSAQNGTADGGDRDSGQFQLPSTSAKNENAAQLATESAGAQGLPEKIAASDASFVDRNGSAFKGLTKSFVATSGKGLTQSNSTFGIGVAERATTMPAGSLLAHQTVPEAAAITSALTATESRQQSDTLPPSVALTSTAHRAVEAVLSVTDRFAAREQHSVNLQFSVGGTDLNVRVELRAGEVHTTFRTDSPELRSALASEWQAVTGQNREDRSARLAPPVFAGNQNQSSSFSGDSAPKQQQQEQRSNGEASARNFLGTLRATGTSTIANATSAATTPASRSVSANSVHLHTLA